MSQLVFMKNGCQADGCQANALVCTFPLHSLSECRPVTVAAVLFLFPLENGVYAIHCCSCSFLVSP